MNFCKGPAGSRVFIFVSQDGENLLVVAARDGQEQVVKALLVNDADPDVENQVKRF